MLNDGGVKLSPKVWECAAGQGHLSERLKEYGYEVYSTDLVYRGYGKGGIDFLKQFEFWDGVRVYLDYDPDREFEKKWVIPIYYDSIDHFAYISDDKCRKKYNKDGSLDTGIDFRGKVDF